jgi:hypothetical protein
MKSACVRVILVATAALSLPLAAGSGLAAPKKTASGSKGDLSWSATSTVVGQTSTATIVSGGDPIYTGAFPAYSGTVGLLMDYGADGAFVCSGSLLGDRRSIVTAGHCVSSGGGVADAGLLSVTAFFRGPASGVDTHVYSGDPSVFAVDVSDIFVNPDYTGEVIDQNDIAVLRLDSAAPLFAEDYELFTAGDLTGLDFNVAGYGTRSVVGGAEGTTGPGAGAGVGRLRQGDNMYDYAWGDAAFAGFFTDEDGFGENFFGFADVEFSFVSDFDNGLDANDTACAIAVAVAGAGGLSFCDTGRGAMEASIAGGDSGGPGFIDGKLASVNSYGLSFGTDYGDYKGGLQSSWGEFNGFVPIYIHEDFILSKMVTPGAPVPEPATWLQMIVGFGLLGGAMRGRVRKLRFA